MSSRTERRRGFTLIELLVVIAIIATLASVVGPSIFGNVGEAKRTAAKAQLASFSLALDGYRLDLDAYPSSDEGLGALREPPPGLPQADRWRGPYLRQAVPLDPWGRPWIYVSPGTVNPSSFDLFSLGRDGERGGAGDDADVTSWNGPLPP